MDENACDKQRSWLVLKCQITGSERLRTKKGSQDCTRQDKELCPESSQRKVVLLINDRHSNSAPGSLLDRLIVTN